MVKALDWKPRDLTPWTQSQSTPLSPRKETLANLWNLAKKIVPTCRGSNQKSKTDLKAYKKGGDKRITSDISVLKIKYLVSWRRTYKDIWLVAGQ